MFLRDIGPSRNEDKNYTINIYVTYKNNVYSIDCFSISLHKTKVLSDNDTVMELKDPHQSCVVNILFQDTGKCSLEAHFTYFVVCELETKDNASLDVYIQYKRRSKSKRSVEL